MKLNKIPRTTLTRLKSKSIKKISAKWDSLVDRNLFFPRIKRSNLQSLILNGVRTRVLLSDMHINSVVKNADDLDVYFTLADAACISPTVVLLHSVKDKNRSIWVPFRV